MPFLNGRVSYVRLRVVGPNVKSFSEQHLQQLEESAFDPEMGFGAGSSAEHQAGWTGGAHIYDDIFDDEHNVFDSGRLAHFGLRIDTNRVPAEVKNAIKAQHSAAMIAASPTGFLNRAEKRDLKDQVEDALKQEASSGKHRQSKLVPLVWDGPRDALLFATGGTKPVELLSEQWRQNFASDTVSAALEQMSAGAIAQQYFENKGRSRDFEDLLPTVFTDPPAGADAGPGGRPEVPWSAGGPEPHDFLGNEFLIWLWHRCDIGQGTFDVAPDSPGSGEAQTSEVAIAFDNTLQCQCAWAMTGTQSLSASGGGSSPVRTVEASAALGSGKWPRKAGLIIAAEGVQWGLVLQGDRFAVSACALPEPEEKITDRRELTEWRLSWTLRLDELLMGLYHGFLELRASQQWASETGAIRSWINKRRPVRKTGADVETEAKPQSVEAPVTVEAA